MAKSENRACLNCGSFIKVPPHRFETFKYCSMKCKGLAERNKIVAVCEVCSKSFEHISCRSNSAKYCSRKCYHKAQRLKGSIVCSCKHCGKEFKTSPSRKRIYCSRECVNKSEKYVFTPTFQTVRKAMKRRDMIIKCERCEYDEMPEILGVHHKDRNRKNNDLSNLEVLCPNCHSLEHLRHIAHGFKE